MSEKNETGGAAFTLPTRGDVALAECTRDPIFLLQSRRWYVNQNGLPSHVTNYETMEEMSVVLGDEGEYVLVVHDGPNPRREHIAVSEAAAMFSEEFSEEWRTERVFFTRKEGERYGRRRAYNYPEGWRVFCVCAEGELATLLKARSVEPTGVLAAREAE